MAFGEPTEWYDEVTSTMEVASRRGREGAPEGLLVVAARQTAGRGRLGRAWSSPEGGLWLSVLLRPNLPLTSLGLVGTCFAVAAAQAATELAQIEVGIKWPNDLVVRGRKLAGLLSESHLQGGIVDYLVLGMGLNLNVAPEAFPPELQQTATSLLIETGTPVASSEFLPRFLDYSERLYRQLVARLPHEIIAGWRKMDSSAGRQVRLALDGVKTEGVALGIDDTGGLLVQVADRTVSVGQGEVEWL